MIGMRNSLVGILRRLLALDGRGASRLRPRYGASHAHFYAGHGSTPLTPDGMAWYASCLQPRENVLNFITQRAEANKKVTTFDFFRP